MTKYRGIEHLELYRDASFRWRWRRVAANGRTTDQGQSHSFKWNAKRAATRCHPGLAVVVLK